MILLDINIFIYLANGAIKAEKLGNWDISFASITKIEALGYTKITVEEYSYLEALFAECCQLDLDEATIHRSILLRQRHNLSLGDAIIAASALEHNCKLWTANEKDFAQIDELQIYNPMKR